MNDLFIIRSDLLDSCCYVWLLMFVLGETGVKCAREEGSVNVDGASVT